MALLPALASAAAAGAAVSCNSTGFIPGVGGARARIATAGAAR